MTNITFGQPVCLVHHGLAAAESTYGRVGSHLIEDVPVCGDSAQNNCSYAADSLIAYDIQKLYLTCFPD